MVLVATVFKESTRHGPTPVPDPGRTRIARAGEAMKQYLRFRQHNDSKRSK